MPFVDSSTVAFITGGSKGIGKGIAAEVLRQGGKVCLVDIDKTEGERTLSEFQHQYGKERAIFIQTNVADEKALAAAFTECSRTFGQLDIVLNNAGIGDRVQITDKSAWTDEMPANWQSIIDVNLTAVVNGTRLGFREMQKSRGAKGGVIINVASLGGFVGQPYSAVYSATKHGVIGWTRSLGHLRQHGVRVVGLAPGFTDTNLVSSGRASSEVFTAMIDRAAKMSGGLLTVEHIVQGAFMLLDDDKMFGKVLSVSRELGFAVHATPQLYPKGSAEDGSAKTVGLPAKTIAQLPPSKL